MAHMASNGVFGTFETPAVTKEKQGNCERHGAFTDTLLLGTWFGCPTCSDERAQRYEEERRQREAEREEAALRKRMEEAAIPPRFAGKGFASYIANTEAQEKALSVAQDYASNFAQY